MATDDSGIELQPDGAGQGDQSESDSGVANGDDEVLDLAALKREADDLAAELARLKEELETIDATPALGGPAEASPPPHSDSGESED